MPTSFSHYLLLLRHVGHILPKRRKMMTVEELIKRLREQVLTYPETAQRPVLVEFTLGGQKFVLDLYDSPLRFSKQDYNAVLVRGR
jgi:hypothetical protein